MPYDPYGALSRGFLGGLDYIGRFRQMQQEEEFAPLRKEILLLQLEQYKQRTQEPAKRKAALEQLYRTQQPAVYGQGAPGTLPQDVGEMPGGALPQGMDLAGINRQMRGAATREEVLSSIGPERMAELRMMAPEEVERLPTQETYQEQQRKKEAAIQARMYGQAGFTAFKEGRAVEGLASFAQAQLLLGQKPDTQELGAAIKTEKDRELWNDAVKRIGPLGEKVMMGDDREAAGELVRELWALPPSLAPLREYGLKLADKALERAGDPKATQGVKRYHQLRASGKSEMEAWNTIERESPGTAGAMEKAKLVPKELEIAAKLAGQRPSSEAAIKTLDNEGIQIAHGIAGRENFSLEQRATLSAFITSEFRNAQWTGTAMKPEEFERKLRAEVARLKGVPEAALPPEDSKKAKAWWRSALESLGLVSPREGTAPAGRPAPGRPSVPANPPPAMQTREAAMAELTRLVDLGLEQEEAEALMRRAGWGRRGAELGTVLAP